MLTIILQAGGKSTRMGRDKATLPFLGIPLIKRLRDRFEGSGSELAVICNDFAAYQGLGLPLYRDIIPDRGALGGLYTALVVASQPLVGLVAVDLPFASPALLLQLADLIQQGEADAAIPSSTSGIEPLHGVYRKETCLPLVKKALDNQQWRIKSWFDQARMLILDPDETLQKGASEQTFLNLNTPEDWSSAEIIARQLEDFQSGSG